MGRVSVKRIYEEPADDDGRRVLVDRLWPRGIKRDAGAFDEWCKEVAPSTELRKWYGHVPERFDEFRLRYRKELTTGEQSTAVTHLRATMTDGPLTLLTATREPALSEAAVLCELLADEHPDA